ncbi:hypothetical protein JX266_006163 [Neoarthrinium moseri]|nr:hypothetical protein JX266_006163 [Neoarthrinium moseri]
MQGISNLRWQTTLNAITLFTNLISTGLYGNIGLKILYIEVLEPLCNFPALNSSSGRVRWSILSPVFWSVGFIVAGAIPQLAYVSSLAAALFTVMFTYSLPALAAIVFWSRKDAMMPNEQFDPTTDTFSFQDQGFQRYYRGFMQRPFLNIFNIIYFLGGLVCCALGCYAAIFQLTTAFQNGVTTSFTCKSPV